MLNRLLKVAGILLVFCFFVICVRKVLSLYIADVTSIESLDTIRNGNISKSVALINQTIRENPMEPKYYVNRASVFLTIASGETGAERQKYKLMALDDMQNAYKLNPNNLLAIKSLIPLYYYLSVSGSPSSNSSMQIDPEFKSLSKEFYASVFNKAPQDVGVYVLIYKYTKRLEITDINAAAKEKIMQLRPDLFDWYSDLR